MGLEKVREEVLARAKRQAAAIISDAKREEDESLKLATEKADEKKKQILVAAEREVAEMKTRELAASELEVSKMSLDARKKIIDEAYELAAEQIAKSSAAQRKEHIRKLLEKAKNEFEIAKVYVNEKDLKHIDGYKTQITNILGGIIAENKDGTVRVDLSYNSLHDRTRERTMKDVAKILFKE